MSNTSNLRGRAYFDRMPDRISIPAQEIAEAFGIPLAAIHRAVRTGRLRAPRQVQHMPLRVYADHALVFVGQYLREHAQ